MAASPTTDTALAALNAANPATVARAAHHLDGLLRHLVAIGRPAEASAVRTVLEMLSQATGPDPAPNRGIPRAGRV